MMVSISKELCHPVVECEVKENQCLLSPSTAQKTMTIGRNYKEKNLESVLALEPTQWNEFEAGSRVYRCCLLGILP